MKYIPTIGIECHVQLATKTKLFSEVDNDYLVLAQKYNCATALNLLKNNHLFTNNWIYDNFIIMLLKLKNIIKR